jgi:hypothetical protein
MAQIVNARPVRPVGALNPARRMTSVIIVETDRGV